MSNRASPTFRSIFRKAAGLSLALALIGALSACSPDSAADRDSVAEKAADAPAPAEASPPEPPPAFVGRWAATEALCEGGAWEFSADGVNTAGEISCTFDRVLGDPSAYSIQAVCVAQAPPSPSTIQLSVNQTERTLFVQDGPFSQIELLYCGPLES